MCWLWLPEYMRAPSVEMLRTEVRGCARVWTRCGTGAGTSLLRDAARGRAKEAGMMSGGAGCMAASIAGVCTHDV